MSRRDREGRLAFINRLPTTSPPIPATAKQEPKMSRPPWGKVAGVSLTEGGNSLTNIDCVPTNAPTPTTTTQTNPHYTRKAIQFRKRAPPHRALTGPPPTQRGRLNYSPQSMCKPKSRPSLGHPKKHVQKPKAVPLGAPKGTSSASEVAGERLTEGGNSLTNIDCVPTNAPTPTTTVQLTRTIHARPYNSASELPPHRALTGPPPTQRGRLNYSPQSMCKPKSRPPWGKVAGECLTEGGNSLTSEDCPTTSLQTLPLPHKRQRRTKKPSPLGEGGRREPDGRGELAYKPRLRPNQRTYPNHHRATNPHYPRKAI